MPRIDGTGPMGMGAMTGRGLGRCNPRASIAGFGMGLGLGMACRRGLGRMSPNQNQEVLEKDFLIRRKELLKNQLNEVEERLENL